MDFTTNYCGMYWSDGKIQSSVVDGRSAPVSELDASCQKHDAAYAMAKDDGDLNVADTNFYNNASRLGLRGRLYGNLVLYGNKVLRFRPLHAMGNILENSANSGPEVAHRNAWLRGSKISPDESSVAAPGDAAALPPGSTTVYNPSPSDSTETGIDTTVHGGVVYTSNGFASHPDTPRPSPFTSNGLYKPLGRKRKRNKVTPRTQAEYYQLLAALSRSRS